MKTISILITLVFLYINLHSQTFDKTNIDRYFEVLETHNKFMVNTAISKDGKLIYNKSTGFADIENKLKADKNTRYGIGTASKTFTAVLVLKAVEEGKLRLDDTLKKYYPEITNASAITIQHLLSHRSGLKDFMADKNFVSWQTTAQSTEHMLAHINTAGVMFPPDSRSMYSNSNYVLLALILQKTYNKSYEEILQAKIIKPLGLQHTKFGEFSDKKVSKSYIFRGEWEVQPNQDPSINPGAGGIITTATDLTIFCDALFGGKLLKPIHLTLMETVKDGLGSGLFYYTFQKKKVFGYSGISGGFASFFAHIPEEKQTLVILTNANNYNMKEINETVFKAGFGTPFNIPEIITVNLQPEDIEPFLGTWSYQDRSEKFVFTRKGNILMGSLSGQESFPFETLNKSEFSYARAAVTITFKPDSTMILKQNGRELIYKKEQ